MFHMHLNKVACVCARCGVSAICNALTQHKLCEHSDDENERKRQRSRKYEKKSGPYAFEQCHALIEYIRLLGKTELLAKKQSHVPFVVL